MARGGTRSTHPAARGIVFTGQGPILRLFSAMHTSLDPAHTFSWLRRIVVKLQRVVARTLSHIACIEGREVQSIYGVAEEVRHLTLHQPFWRQQLLLFGWCGI